MGLDIRVFRQLTHDPEAALDGDGYPIDWENRWRPGASMDWSENIWPGRGEGLDPTATYSWVETFGFRAGSYSGYGAWRDALARLVSLDRDAKNPPNPDVPWPFYELIVFADNEGTIGPIVSAKLARDFADNEARAHAFAPDDPWFFELYQTWKRAFEMAADGGAVDFR